LAIKLVKVGTAAIPGVLEVLEDYFDVDPIYRHLTRFSTFGAGLIGSLLVREGVWGDVLEALMLSSEPLAIKSIYELIVGGGAGLEETREAIELKLMRKGERQLRPEEMLPQLR